jgi:hypothetical protein
MLGPISRPWTRPCRLVSPIRWPRPWLVETHAFPSQPFRGRGNTGSSLLPKPEDTAIGGSAPSTSCDLFRQRELSGSGTFWQDTFYRVCAKIWYCRLGIPILCLQW